MRTMAVVVADKMFQQIRTLALLEPEQLEEAKGLLPQFPDMKAFARELHRRGWLTVFQINQ